MTMSTMMVVASFVAGLVFLGLGALLALFSATALNVWISVFRHGGDIADEAMKRGDSVKAWWDPAQAPRRSGPQSKFRRARAGRWVKGRGVMARQEQATGVSLKR